MQRSRPHLIRHPGDFDQRCAPHCARTAAEDWTPHSSSLNARSTGRRANQPPACRVERSSSLRVGRHSRLLDTLFPQRTVKGAPGITRSARLPGRYTGWVAAAAARLRLSLSFRSTLGGVPSDGGLDPPAIRRVGELVREGLGGRCEHIGFIDRCWKPPRGSRVPFEQPVQDRWTSRVPVPAGARGGRSSRW